MAKMMLLTAGQLLSNDLAAIIALPGNSVRTAINVYESFNDTQKEHALQQSRDLLDKALELQNTIRQFQYICDGYDSNFKVSLRYLGIEDDEVISDSELMVILKNKIAMKEEELREWMGY